MFKSRLVAGAMAALVVAGTLTVAAAPAEAGWRRGYGPGPGYHGRPYYGPRYGYNRGWNAGGALAVGAIAGLALGAMAANAGPRPYYYAPAPAYYPPPVPAYLPYCFWQYYPNGARAWICT
jgi:hypothetical protein